MQELTLIPRPLYPYEIWQAVTSPPTLDYVPVVAHGAVFWNQHYSFIKRFWDTYGERYVEAHGVELAPHEKRMLVVAVRIEDTLREGDRETALARPRRVLEVPRAVRLEQGLHGSPTASPPSRA